MTEPVDPFDNKIISSHNEINLDRGANFKDVIEQIDPFLDYHLIVITTENSNDNTEIVDRLDQLKLDRSIFQFKEKKENKSQWIFKGPNTTEYTVFSNEAYDF